MVTQSIMPEFEMETGESEIPMELHTRKVSDETERAMTGCVFLLLEFDF